MKQGFIKLNQSQKRSMILFILLIVFADLSHAQTSADKPKPATEFTRKANDAVYKQLDFSDSTDWTYATKGFIASIDSGKVYGADGRLVIDESKYDFIKGKAPASVNPALWRHAELDDINGLFKITDGVYQVRGIDVANIMFVQTKKGYIVIDVSSSAYAAKAALNLMKKYVGDKPVLAVVSTHSHGDHYGGIEGITSREDIASGKVKYIVPKGFYGEAVSESVLLGNAMRRRATYQFGSKLPFNEYGQIDVGLGKIFTGFSTTLLPPNKEIENTGDTVMIDGTELVFQLTPGTEAPAEFTIYLPQRKVFFPAELITNALHNILTPRGAKTRDTKAWSNYIDEAIDLFGDSTDIVVPSHTWPTYGHKQSIELLEKQRDLYKYIHDQTVHLANKGLDKEEIAATIKLPDELSKEWYNRDFYGTVNHNSKAIYQFYLGWWNGNPAEYNPLPEVEGAKKYVEWMGGEEAVLKKAQESYNKGEYRWVAEVTNHVVFANPTNQKAKNLEADALEQLGYQSESGIWRDLYLTGAKELREGITPTPVAAGAATKLFSNLTPEALFDFLSVSIDGEKAKGKEISLRFIIPELQKNILIYLKNGVLHQSAAKANVQADFTLTASKQKLAELLSNPDKTKEILASEGVSFQGNPSKLGELLSCMERFNPDWNIVTP